MWTTVKLAEATGVSTAYIRRLLIAGKLKGEKSGRDWIILDEEAQRYLQERRDKGLLPEPPAET